MIKDVMVRLDGTSGDDLRLAAVKLIAEIFDSHITGLLFNVLPPPPIQAEINGAGVNQATEPPEAARKAGDAIEAAVFERLTQLHRPTILRRFDVLSDEISDTALPLARAADTFVALRPNGRSNELEGLIENLLFGTGRHLFLVPDELKAIAPFDHVVVAWNGSRESARALAEALPYLHRAKKVAVLVVESEHPGEADALKANEAVLHLRHHGIDAMKYRAAGEDDEIAEVLIEVCRRLGANLLVMGSYGHSRLHELLPGSTTDRILRRSPLPLLIAH